MCHIYFKDNLKEVFEVLKSKFQQTASFHSIIEARLNTGNNNINECYSMVTAIYLIDKGEIAFTGTIIKERVYRNLHF